MDYVKRYWVYAVIALCFATSAYLFFRGTEKADRRLTSYFDDGAPAPICIVPIGSVGKNDVVLAAEILAASFDRPVEILEPLPLQTMYYSAERGQYCAYNLLRYLEANAPLYAYKTVGLTASDVYVADLNFVFGISRNVGKCAVLSTRRLGFEADARRVRDLRFAKLLIHEVGHAYGLYHCRQPLCTMEFAEGYMSLDSQRFALCERCERYLCRRLSCDPRTRRTALAATLKRQGLWEAAGGEAGTFSPPAPTDVSPDPEGNFR